MAGLFVCLFAWFDLLECFSGCCSSNVVRGERQIHNLFTNIRSSEQPSAMYEPALFHLAINPSYPRNCTPQYFAPAGTLLHLLYPSSCSNPLTCPFAAGRVFLSQLLRRRTGSLAKPRVQGRVEALKAQREAALRLVEDLAPKEGETKGT